MIKNHFFGRFWAVFGHYNHLRADSDRFWKSDFLTPKVTQNPMIHPYIAWLTEAQTPVWWVHAPTGGLKGSNEVQRVQDKKLE